MCLPTAGQPTIQLVGKSRRWHWIFLLFAHCPLTLSVKHLTFTWFLCSSLWCQALPLLSWVKPLGSLFWTITTHQHVYFPLRLPVSICFPDSLGKSVCKHTALASVEDCFLVWVSRTIAGTHPFIFPVLAYATEPPLFHCYHLLLQETAVTPPLPGLKTPYPPPGWGGSMTSATIVPAWKLWYWVCSTIKALDHSEPAVSMGSHPSWGNGSHLQVEVLWREVCLHGIRL